MWHSRPGCDRPQADTSWCTSQSNPPVTPVIPVFGGVDHYRLPPFLVGQIIPVCLLLVGQIILVCPESESAGCTHPAERTRKSHGSLPPHPPHHSRFGLPFATSKSLPPPPTTPHPPHPPRGATVQRRPGFNPVSALRIEIQAAKWHRELPVSVPSSSLTPPAHSLIVPDAAIAKREPCITGGNVAEVLENGTSAPKRIDRAHRHIPSPDTIMHL